MIYDMRIYDLKPGAVPEYMAAVKEIALPVRQQYGVKLAGFYYTEVGVLNRVVHIWAYRDMAHLEQARQASSQDPRWVKEFLPRVRPLIVRQEDHLVRAADFSPQPA